MLDEEDRPLTFLRFGIQRKKDFLRDVKKAFDGLVLPGNILLYQYRSTPLAVFMCERPFFVDPMSYLFGQPFEDFKQRVQKGPRFKPSFHRLMEGHGFRNPNNFLPYDYTEILRFLNSSERNLSVFADDALSFQKNNVWETIQEAQDLMTEDQKIGLEEANYQPKFLIPPYFLYVMGKEGRRALTTDLNARILDHCWSGKTKWGDLFPMVFLRKESLESDLRNEVVSIVKNYKFPGYCIWVEDFDERQATRSQVRALIDLIRALSEGDCQVVMLYGGFFSMLLFHFGLTCVCHGLAYGEARSITAAAQQGSGPAPIRYYIIGLHSFLTLNNALIILRSRPDLICSCPICQRVIGGDPERVTRFNDEEALAEMHFLWNRNEERKMIGETRLEGLIQDLDYTLTLNEDIESITKRYRVYGGYEERPVIDPRYIREWKAALEEAAGINK